MTKLMNLCETILGDQILPMKNLSPEDSRRFKPAPLVDVPQITHEQLRFIEKINSCYYKDNKDQLRDRHTGQIVKL